MPDELWKSIPGYPNYEVSNQGRVRSWLVGGAWTNHRKYKGKRAEIPRILKNSLGKNGYHRVNLSNKEGLKVINTHILVLIAFNGDRRSEGLECLHSDNDSTNNWLYNLSWGTRQKNCQDAYDTGAHVAPVGEACFSSKLTESQVLEIYELAHNSGRSQQVIADQFGIHRTQVSAIKLKKWWKATLKDCD